MSGLAGWVDGGCDLGQHAGIVRKMVGELRHRGPDGEGLWVSRHAALGHRQRAADDAGPDPRPALAELGGATVALVCDVTLDCRAELLRAVERTGGRTAGRPTTEAELLLAAYLLWGAALVDRLDGAFAIAVWDGRTRRLLLFRDRIGIKPLYSFSYPGGVLFGSEPKAIIANPRFRARLDPSAIPILLQPRLTRAGETPIAGLREVPPAHVVSYAETGDARSHRYWSLTSAPHHDSFVETAAHVRALLADTVERQLPRTGPCAAMLSGGIDSTSVAALATRGLRGGGEDRDLDTFCLRFADDGAAFVPTALRPDLDAPYAAAAADFMGSRHTTVTVTVQDLVDVVPATRRARDLPGWGQFDASMYLLFGRMRDASAVALSGEAADEWFGGYPHFFERAVIDGDGFPWLGRGPRLSHYLSEELLAIVDPIEDERDRYDQALADVPRLPGEDPANARMREILFLGVLGPLAVVLDRKERMSAAQGVEVRLPFCDHRLIEYLWNVPWAMKAHGGRKGLLAAAMGDILPPSTASRRKSAYPHAQSPVYERAVVREARRAVNDEHSPIRWMFDRPRLNGLIDEIAANQVQQPLPGGASGPQLLIQLVEMARWVDEYGVAMP